MEASCLDSYAGTITRLRNRHLEDEKKVMFLCRTLVNSQRHITETYAKGQAIFHHKLPVQEITSFSMTLHRSVMDIEWCRMSYA